VFEIAIDSGASKIILFCNPDIEILSELHVFYIHVISFRCNVNNKGYMTFDPIVIFKVMSYHDQVNMKLFVIKFLTKVYVARIPQIRKHNIICFKLVLKDTVMLSLKTSKKKSKIRFEA
jgi:hypothetical protein